MSNIKKHYEEFWSKRNEEFESYARNLPLKSFFNRGDRLLDVGCGDGTVGEYLQKDLGLEVWGIDISEEAVKKAKTRGINAKVANSEESFPFGSGTFDVVFWGDNIEHLFDPLICAKEIKRVLKSNGRLIVSCPNMAYWRYRFHYFLKGELADTEWTGYERWNWSHIRFFNINILNNFFRKTGFNKISKIMGVSSRRLDKLFLPFSPTLFGMILILEVK